MAKKYPKTVLLPIVVPYGNYCWDRRESRTCTHFTDECGWDPECDLGIGSLNYDKNKCVPKPKECKSLKEMD